MTMYGLIFISTITIIGLRNDDDDDDEKEHDSSLKNPSSIPNESLLEEKVIEDQKTLIESVNNASNHKDKKGKEVVNKGKAASKESKPSADASKPKKEEKHKAAVN